MVEECVRDIARSYTTTRFVQLNYEEAEMEVAGVPAILAYRGGDKFAGLVPVVDEIPEDQELSVKSLALLLEKYVITFIQPSFLLLVLTMLQTRHPVSDSLMTIFTSQPDPVKISLSRLFSIHI